MRTFESADQMALDMVVSCIREGEHRGARGKGTLDVACWNGTLLNPRSRVVRNPARALRTGYPAASVAWNLDERDDCDSICWWNERGRAISDDGTKFYGANYGQRWSLGLKRALRLFAKDSGTRRAWVPIWRPEDIEDGYSEGGSDVPCTVGFGLSIRVLPDLGIPTLDMSVHMRSQSAWAVFPYDIYLFTVLQELIANELGLMLGRTHWSCVSLHVYENELDWVRAGIQAIEDFDPTATEDMGSITATLGEARIAYPAAMDMYMRGEALDDRPDDPVLRQMIEGAKEILGDRSALA